MPSTRGDPQGTDFESWLAAREPALQRLATLLTGDAYAGRDLLRPVLARLCLDWHRIGSDDAEDRGRELLLEEHRRTWDPGGSGAPGSTRIRLTGEYDGVAEAASALVESLPARARAIVVVRHHQQLTDGESARLLRLPVSIVHAEDQEVLTVLRDHLERQRVEHPGATGPGDPAQLLVDALHARAEEATYLPSDPAEILGSTQARKRRRRRATALGVAAVLALALAVPGLGSEETGPTTEATPPPRGPTPYLSTLPQGGPPGIPYLVDSTYVAPDGGRTDLRVAFPMSAAPDGTGFLVTDSRSFDGVLGMHRVDSRGRVVDRWSTTSELLAGDDERPAVWVRVTDPGDDPRRSVIRRGADREVTGAGVSLVASLGDRVVYRQRGSRGAWSTDLRGPPERIRGLRRVEDVHGDLVAGRRASGDGVVVEAGSGTVRWTTSRWRPVSFSPDGRHLVALPRRSRSHVAILAADGSLRGTIRRFGSEADELRVLDLTWEDDSHVLLLVAQYGRSAIVRADLDGTLNRATSPLVADLAGGSRYRFASH